MDDPVRDDPVLVVPNDWAPAPGARLRAGVFLSSRLAAGAQGSIWRLRDDAGTALPAVLKLAHGPAAVVAPIEREWVIGRRLNAVPGFVPSGAGVRTAGGRFVGVLLSRIVGRTLASVLADPDFADAPFLVEALRQVFTALDAAQAAYGFAHNDLRLANVMQVEMQVGAAGGPRFVIIDYGLASWSRGPATGPDLVLRRGVDDVAAAPPPPLPYVDVSALEGGTRSYHRHTPLERVHAAAWRDKGDVYHLLLELAAALSGRAWPHADGDDVCRLLDLIQHATGVRPLATVVAAGVPPPPRPPAPLRALARGWLRVRAWVLPSCPSLLAGEALTAPAFTGRRSCRLRWVE